MYKLVSEKPRGARDQTAYIRWIIEKAREFQKHIYFCFIDYAKAFDCVDHDKPWKTFEEIGIPNHLTCLMTMYSLDVLLSQFGTSLVFHVWF